MPLSCELARCAVREATMWARCLVVRPAGNLETNLAHIAEQWITYGRYSLLHLPPTFYQVAESRF